MNIIQKDMLMSSLKKRDCGEQANWVPDLLRALDKSNIQSELLALPIINLEIEKFIPSGQMSVFINSCDVDKLMRSAIVFDLYLPSVKLVANFSLTLRNAKDSSYLKEAIQQSVSNTVHSLQDPNDLMDPSRMKTEAGNAVNMSMVLEDAVMAYFNAHSIKHPLDMISNLRTHADNMLLNPENIDAFVYQIEKLK